MEYKKLLKILNTGIIPEYFPTPMQAFIFRNWHMISKERLAEVLETETSNVDAEAKRMGLGEQGDVSAWLKKGYITIIRSNWHLLPYEQLLKLLDWDEDKLNLALKEEDFLEVKLGGFKPECEKIIYRELTDREKKQTDKIRENVELAQRDLTDINAPFDFWSKKLIPALKSEPKNGQLILDNGWEIRQTNLLDFVKRAKGYGIKVYLYINEPRSMPHSFFEKYPDMKGSSRERYSCMCLMHPKTQEYLSGAVEYEI